jgi:hypothetical protein
MQAEHYASADKRSLLTLHTAGKKRTMWITVSNEASGSQLEHTSSSPDENRSWAVEGQSIAIKATHAKGWYMIKGKDPVFTDQRGSMYPVFIARHRGPTVITLFCAGSRIFTGTREDDADFRQALDVSKWTDVVENEPDGSFWTGVRREFVQNRTPSNIPVMSEILSSLPRILSGYTFPYIDPLEGPILLKDYIEELRHSGRRLCAARLDAVISLASGGNDSLRRITGTDWWTRPASSWASDGRCSLSSEVRSTSGSATDEQKSTSD